MRTNILLILTAAISLLCAPMARADIELPAIFADHMVLQRDEPVRIWGHAEAGANVTLEFAGLRTISKADRDGRWMVSLAAMPATDQPQTMTISSDDQVVTIADVLVGEVWLCSGQSNMEWRLNGTQRADEFKAAANDSRIRMFTVPKLATHEPQEDVPGNWRVASPQTVGSFSAVAYHFGRNLAEQLDVPIGLIHSSWGGSTVEAWISRPVLETLPAARPFVNAYDQTQAAVQMAADTFTTPNIDSAQWDTMTLPTLIEDAGHNIDGIMWFRRTVDLPQAWMGKDLNIALGPIDDNDITYFNGERIGATNNYQIPRVYSIPGKLVKPGTAVIAIRVEDTGGAGGFNGSPGQMTLTCPAASEQSIDLSGAWHWRVASSAPSVQTQHRPANLYNAMIHGLREYTIRGSIWYQGESNALGDRGEEYFTLFPAMIVNWRSAFENPDMPFYYVQLPDFTNDEPNTPWRYPLLRQAQLATLTTVPHTGMAITLELGEANDIHPRNKHDVGDRLARLALADAYGRTGFIKSGPVPVQASFDAEGRVTVRFNAFGSTLSSRDGEALHGFEVAGADGHYKPANARIDGTRVIIFSGDAPRPVHVRYAWKNNTTGCNLANADGWPASPFKFTREPTSH